jgi:hypothetical protein
MGPASGAQTVSRPQSILQKEPEEELHFSLDFD